MAKYCGRCGAKLDEKTGLCPNCDSKSPKQMVQQKEKLSSNQAIHSKKSTSENQYAKKKREKRENKGRKGCLPKLLLALVAILLIGIAIIELLGHKNIFDMFFSPQTEEIENFRVDGPDADAYFGDKATDVIAVIDVNDSEEPLAEADTYNTLFDRGFQGYPITTEYSMAGEYSEAAEISNTSTEKHPIYQTLFLSSAGEIWTIFYINGQVIANPVMYNLQSGSEIQVLFAEDDTITSYDSATNQFYETIPKPTEIIVERIDRIDSESLDMYTTEMIADMCNSMPRA